MGEKCKITNGTYWSWWQIMKYAVAPFRQFRGRNSGCKKISTEKKSSMLMGSALMCSVLERAS